jgi:S-(hydroxymethyl)glutathione dehydrogenase/alcohol dehydrogenase
MEKGRQMKTRAAVLRAPHAPLKIENLDLDPPHSGEVQIRMAAAGVCHSDWHVINGDTRHVLPVVLGHEGAGMVETVGEGVTRVKPGDHVSLNWAPNCGACYYCLNHRPSLCTTFLDSIWAGTMMDGTTRFSKDGQPIYHFSALACFAERVVVPQECCVPLDPEVPFPIAALIGCAVTTGVGAVLNTARVAPGSSVAVVGVGGVGLSAVMGARLAGASRIIAVDRTLERAERARAFGATHTLANRPTLGESVRELTRGRGADTVIEAVGAPAVQEACLSAVRPGGTLVLVGLAPMGTSTDFPGALLTRQEKTVMGCYYGTADTTRDFPLYADLYLQGRLDLDGLISRTYPLEEINQAFQDMLAGELARGVILYGGEGVGSGMN